MTPALSSLRGSGQGDDIRRALRLWMAYLRHDYAHGCGQYASRLGCHWLAGLDELRWLKPVFPGDTLRVRSTIVSKKASRSRPEMGSMVMENEVLNQSDEVVLRFNPIVMYRRRPAD